MLDLRITDGTVPCSHLSNLDASTNHLVPREIIKAQIPAWAFKLLNLTFISFMQSVFLFSLAAPVYPILLSTQFQPEAGVQDLAFSAFELVLIAVEWAADQQQWGKSPRPSVHPKTTTVADTPGRLPNREVCVQGYRKAPKGLPGCRSGPRLLHIRSVGLQQTPQFRRGADDLGRAVRLERVPDQHALLLGRLGSCGSALHLLRLDHPHRGHHRGQVPRVQAVPTAGW